MQPKIRGLDQSTPLKNAMKRPLLPVLPLIIVAAVVAVLSEHSNRCVAAVSTILKVWKGSDISFMMMRMPVGLSYLQTTLKFTGYIDLFDAFHDPMPNILTFSEQKGIECNQMFSWFINLSSFACRRDQEVYCDPVPLHFAP